MAAVLDEISPVLDFLVEEDPGGVVGIYLYGSGAATGLYPDSDIDLLFLTRRSLTSTERAALVSRLLDVSGWSGHASSFPEVANRRPVELTGAVVDDVRAFTGWPRRDFQFGEWMRSELVDGVIPVPNRDADLVILFSTAWETHRVLHGCPLQDVVPPIPRDLLQQAQLDLLPEVLDGFVGDERNVLLTLARMVVAAESGQILPKHDAAERIHSRLNASEAVLLMLARDEYLGKIWVDWHREHERGLDVAHSLQRLVLDAADFS